MALKQTHSHEKQDHYSPEFFLRSINIVLDAEFPERITHFQPTAKCVNLIRSLLGHETERCFFIQAPYGSGKSLSACYLTHLIENKEKSSHALKLIQDRLEGVSPELHKFSRERHRKRDSKGLVLLLHGYCADLPQALKRAAADALGRLGMSKRSIARVPIDDIGGAIKVFQNIEKTAAEEGLDRVVILWDEFGRHLESLLSEGNSSSLIEVQQIGEYAPRSKKTPITIGLLLHQSLTQYADSTSHAVREEWRKVEGRFRTIRYVDDSQEIYRLVAEVVSARRGRCKRALAVDFHKAAKLAQDQGLFCEMSLRDLKGLLAKAYPLTPTTLHLLPRLSARVAQSERTLFTFLYAQDMEKEIAPTDIYEYFTDAMRSDTSVGGTFKQWLETQSAVSKTESKDEETVIKTACLLTLGTSGERTRVSKGLLSYALQGHNNGTSPSRHVSTLIKRKLLLYRKHSKEISVWHGTDVDLRGRLSEEMARNRVDFDLLQFLGSEANPPVWFSVQYNDDFHVRRYFSGGYHTERSLKEHLDESTSQDSILEESDGFIFYVLTESAEELIRIKTLLRTSLSNKRLLVVIPQSPLDLLDAALEVYCLSHMEMDSTLVESDPLVLTEIQQMIDDARSHLQITLDKLLVPGSTKAEWYHNGATVPMENAGQLQKFLSDIMRDVYPDTPRINNEMIVRKRLPANVVNSRKKLVMGILERSGIPELGIKGNFPDMSMFRTVLLHTGLYREDKKSGRWGYASSNEIEDEGLSKVWTLIGKFFTAYEREPKSFSDLFCELKKPPFGVRSEIIPILLSAGYKAFPAAYSLSRDGEYLPDILPSNIEDIYRKPDRYLLKVLDLKKEQKDYLEKVYSLFSESGNKRTINSDLIRSCYDAFEEWSYNLSPAARTTRQVGNGAARLQTMLRRSDDPVRLFLTEIPEAFSKENGELSGAITPLKTAKNELEKTIDLFQKAAMSSLRKAIAPHEPTEGVSLREAATHWTSRFSGKVVPAQCVGETKGFLSCLGRSFESDEGLIESVASILTGKKVARWDDSTIVFFDKQVIECAYQIEQLALENGSPEEQSELIQSRMIEQYGHLQRLIGLGPARKILESLVETKK